MPYDISQKGEYYSAGNSIEAYRSRGVIPASKFSRLVSIRDDFSFPTQGMQVCQVLSTMMASLRDGKWAEYCPHWGHLLDSETSPGLDDFSFP